MKTSAILLAGGRGTRMGTALPKQYLTLGDQPLVLFSYAVLLPLVDEVIVVCEPEWQHLFPEARFAPPGIRRQDSVANGVAACSDDSELLCIHDGARPCITTEKVHAVLQVGKQMGAAALGVPVKPTIKEVSADGVVQKTLDRKALWEVQTPQVIRKDLLDEALAKAAEENWEVTDDLSLIEQLGHPTRLVYGSYGNIKVTTPEDLALAEMHLVLGLVSALPDSNQ